MITDRKIDALGRNRPVMTDRIATAANLVINHGVDEQTAMELATGRKVSKRTVEGFKDKVRKYALAAAPMVKLAHNAVKETLKMQPVEVERQAVNKEGEVITYTDKILPSHTNRLAAAAMVLDRDQPIIKHTANVNINVDCDPFDLGELRG